MNLSICMIVKNAERDIARCLSSIISIADEIIIYDTGSSDNTVAIARLFPKVNIILGEWIDDFAWARNKSIMSAKGKWIMWMDADDELMPQSYEMIDRIKNDPANCALSCAINNVEPAILSFVKYKEFEQIRIFPNRKDIEFRGILHETISESVSKTGIPTIYVPEIKINHYGYIHQKELKDKMKRNIRLKLWDMGFSNDVGFFEFEFGEYLCFYQSKALSVWMPPKMIGIEKLTPEAAQAAIDSNGLSLISIASKVIDDDRKKVRFINGQFASDNEQDEIQKQISRLEQLCAGK